MSSLILELDHVFVGRFAGGRASGLDPGPAYQISTHMRAEREDLVVLRDIEALRVAFAIILDVSPRAKRDHGAALDMSDEAVLRLGDLAAILRLPEINEWANRGNQAGRR